MKRIVRKYPCKDLTCKKLECLLKVEVWGEWKFHATRKWRFDYAIPEWMLAVEQDGGVFMGGRHSGGINQVHDMEKMNEAAKLGWRVLHYTPEQMRHLAKVADDLIKAHENDKGREAQNGDSDDSPLP